MAEKTSVKLNIGERFTLLALLQNFKDWASYKILQKLRMTLAPDEKESAEYEFESNFRCPHTTYDKEGKRFLCEFEEFGKKAPKCPIHNVYCVPTGIMRWKPEMANKEKEIWFGNKAKSLIVETLTRLNEEKKLTTDMDVSLYVKFVQGDKEEED